MQLLLTITVSTQGFAHGQLLSMLMHMAVAQAYDCARTPMHSLPNEKVDHTRTRPHEHQRIDCKRQCLPEAIKCVMCCCAHVPAVGGGTIQAHDCYCHHTCTPKQHRHRSTVCASRGQTCSWRTSLTTRMTNQLFWCTPAMHGCTGIKS